MHHMKVHKMEKPLTCAHTGQGICCKTDQTGHISLHSGHQRDKMMSCQQTCEDLLISHFMVEMSNSPEVVKQQADAESIICKTDQCLELASIVPQSSVNAQVDNTDIFKEEL